MQSPIASGGVPLLTLSRVVLAFSSGATVVSKPRLVFWIGSVCPVCHVLLLEVLKVGVEDMDVVVRLAGEHCVPGHLPEDTSHSWPLSALPQPDGPVVFLLTRWGEVNGGEDGEVIRETHDVQWVALYTITFHVRQNRVEGASTPVCREVNMVVKSLHNCHLG